MERIFRLSVCLLFACISFGSTGLAQQFHFKNYSVGEGLPQSQVYALLEDSRGYIWMGTRAGGLSRFDGINFTTFTIEDGLPDNAVFCLYEGSEGNIWIGTAKGVCTFNGLDFVPHLLHEQERQPPIGAICQDENGQYWFGTGAGLYRYDGKETRSLSPLPNYPKGRISALLPASKGGMWVGHDRGVSLINSKKVVHFDATRGLRSQVSCLSRDSTGTIWAGTYGGGMFLLKGDRVEPLINKLGLNESVIFDVLHDSNGQVWITTPVDGVKLWSGQDSSFTAIDEDDGLANNHVRCALEDRWGNLWFGTSGGGVSKYFGQQFIHFDDRNGLPGSYVYAVRQDSKGRLWVGTSGKGVTRIENGKYHTYRADSGFYNEKVKSIYEDHLGRMWFGTEGKGLSCLHDSGFAHFSGSNGLSGNWIRDITEDAQHQLWIATAGGGVTKMTPKDSLKLDFDFDFFTTTRGMPKNRINCLHRDSLDRIWFGTYTGGIGFIWRDSVYAFPNEQLASLQIRSMVEDNYGVLWVGTAKGGVNGISIYGDSLKITTINRASGLSSNNIYSLSMDQQNNLWVGSETGLDQVQLDADRQAFEYSHYAREEGFVGIENCLNAAWRSTDGNLWFGTINGLTCYNPQQRMDNPLPPILEISKISLFYESLRNTDYGQHIGPWGQLEGTVEFPFNQNHLGFDFVGLNHKNHEKVRYQWRLVPFDKDWSPVSKKTDATYSNLPPGDYTFQVRACNEDGIWTPEPAESSFTILKPIWETWWFRAVFGGVFLLLIALFFNLRLRQIKRKNQQLQAQLQLEKGLLELEQKALRLQMNPHFIFNALNSIQGVIARKDDKTARYYLAKFSKLMRMILENSRSQTVSLSEEISTLESYLALERFSRGERFDYQLTVEESLDPDDIHIPPMMIQPFLENAVIHGVGHLDNQGLIKVHFKQEAQQLIGTIEDNGIGRQQAKAIKSQIGQHHKSTALAVTQERLDILNNGATIEHHSLEITDLQQADGAASGTLVTIRIPAQLN